MRFKYVLKTNNMNLFKRKFSNKQELIAHYESLIGNKVVFNKTYFRNYLFSSCQNEESFDLLMKMGVDDFPTYGRVERTSSWDKYIYLTISFPQLSDLRFGWNVVQLMFLELGNGSCEAVNPPRILIKEYKI